MTGNRDVKSTENYDTATDEAQQMSQYSSAINEDTNNGSQIQTHINNQYHFNPVQQMNNFVERIRQSFVFSNCQVTFNIAGSSFSLIACSD